MKNLKLFAGIVVLLAARNSSGQTTTHLKLSDQYPSPGEKVSLSYDPSGTAAEGKKDVAAAVYYLDNKNYPVADISLTPEGGILKGEIAIPETAKAFFIRISSEEKVDNNNDLGYVYLVYKGKQPVVGAYASEGYFFSSGMGAYFAKIKSNLKTGAELYQKEFALYPKNQKEYQAGYYTVIARNPDNRAEVNQKISALQSSNDENDLILAASLLRITKDLKGADSLKAVIKTRFPDGIATKNEMGTAISNERDPAKKEALYKDYINKYPAVTTEQVTAEDNFRVQLAGAYLQKGDLDNYNKYAALVKNKYGLAGDLNNEAYEWAKKGTDLAQAEKLSKESLDLVKEKIDNPAGASFSSPAQARKNDKYMYDMYADTYAFILFKENKVEQALKYEQPVFDHNTTVDPEVSEHYVLMLAAAGQSAKAIQVAENTIKAGKGTDATKELLKNEYVKAKGSDSGYGNYIASLESAAKDKARADLSKTMTNQPAPPFALKDLEGNTITLADLKGKVVIVDFWATWCGPCKASFPGMQMAVEKYKDDPNVKFLFVDTWENGDNYVPGVKQFIAGNKYPFHVLIDEKGEDGRQSKVVSSFKVTGIPTKFIIDRNGNIRFMYVGYSGTPEALVEEVTNMIDMASNPLGVASAQKVSASK